MKPSGFLKLRNNQNNQLILNIINWGEFVKRKNGDFEKGQNLLITQMR